MLYTYATLMALILLVEIGLAVTIYVFKGDARDFVSKAMRDGMKNYDTDVQSEHEGVKETWNVIQVCLFQCLTSDHHNFCNFIRS